MRHRKWYQVADYHDAYSQWLAYGAKLAGECKIRPLTLQAMTTEHDFCITIRINECRSSLPKETDLGWYCFFQTKGPAKFPTQYAMRTIEFVVIPVKDSN
jgi:hypothetical protein